MKKFFLNCSMLTGLSLAVHGFAGTAVEAPDSVQQLAAGSSAESPSAETLSAAAGTSGPVEKTNAVTVVTAPATNNWQASIYGGFTAKSGNTTSSSYNYGGEFEKKNSELYRYKLTLDGRYSKTDNQISESKAQLSGEMRRMFTERWFVSGRLSAMHDDLKDLSYRAKAGPGIGRYLVDSKTLKADLSTGLLYVREKSAGEASGYVAWRLSQRIDWQITETFKAWAETEYFMDVADSAIYQITFKSGVDSRINRHLSLVVSVEDDYDSLPDQVTKIEKNDLEIHTGLRYHF